MTSKMEKKIVTLSLIEEGESLLILEKSQREEKEEEKETNVHMHEWKEVKGTDWIECYCGALIKK